MVHFERIILRESRLKRLKAKKVNSIRTSNTAAMTAGSRPKVIARRKMTRPGGACGTKRARVNLAGGNVLSKEREKAAEKGP